MTTRLIYPYVRLDLPGAGITDLEINSGRLTIDSGIIPYGIADLVLPLDAAAPLDPLDPRDDVRLIVNAASGISTPRPFNLGIRERRVDYVAKTITVRATTDEALLQDYAVLTSDNGARAYEGSLRAIVDYVLGKVIPGAALEPGTDDANMTAAWEVSLLNYQPQADTTAGFSVGSTATISTSTNTPFVGSAVIVWTSTNATAAFISPNMDRSVRPGATYTFSGYFRAGTPATSRPIWTRWIWRDRDGVEIGRNNATPVAVAAGLAWTRVVSTYTAPVGAAVLELAIVANVTAAGQTQALDGIMIYEGSETIPFFYGGTAADSLYTYSWSGDPSLSSSVRTPIVERDPSLFVWEPGETAWEFLEPLLTVAGLRLYCDELRRWYLVDPSTWTVPGLKSLSGTNTTDASDTISRDDPQVFATGVVVRYAWTDANDLDRVAFDTAGTPDKVVRIDYARPFPGPGAAAAILARRNGTGRTQEITALVDYTTSPGMEAQISLPDTITQGGRIVSVGFDLNNGAEMSVGTRGLIDIPASSWLAWTPAAQAWQDVPVGTTWVSLPA